MKKEEQLFGILLPLGLCEQGNIPKLTYSASSRKMYKVWSEGYRATGEVGYATYHGECYAESFNDACEVLIKGIDRNEDGTLRISNSGHPSVWACRLFDNEADARKSFG